MSLYDFDTNFIGPKLMPPALRQIKHVAWIKTLLKPIQTLWGIIFNDYADGSNYPFYEHPTTYNTGDRVIGADKRVYQALQTTVGHFIDDPNYWVLVNHNFMGARERILYNSQKIVLEYALNKWFFVTASPFIYITTNATAGNLFLLGETGKYSSPMAEYSGNQVAFLGQSYTVVQYDFTVYVPNLLFNAIATSTDNSERVVRNFVDQYCLAGIKYNVIPY